MPRTRIISDRTVFALIRALLAETGTRSVTFAAVAQRTGLSAPSLVQRYLSRDAMELAALQDGWKGLEAATAAAIRATPLSTKGASALLKAIAPDDLALPVSEIPMLTAHLADPGLRARATAWRGSVVEALAVRLGRKDRDGAEALFAAWQGRILWQPNGGDGFRLRDLQRRLSDKS